MIHCLWRWARELSGAAGGTVAMAAACLSPNLIAHAALATTDFAVAATYFAAFYGLRRFLQRPAPRRLLLAGLLGGLALASKLSALLWLPTALALLAWTALSGPEEARLRLGAWAGAAGTGRRRARRPATPGGRPRRRGARHSSGGRGEERRRRRRTQRRT